MQSRPIAAFLNHKRHDLAEAMGWQLQGGVVAFDNGGELAACPPGVDLVITRPDNIFFGPGWNWAMDILDGMGYTHVWMLNDDTLQVKGKLAGLLDLLPDNAAAVTPPFNSPHQVFHPQATGSQGPYTREVRWIDWTCPLVRMDAWKDVGPFDERFLGYGADLDWCRRAREKGWKFYVAEIFPVHHIGSATALSQGLQGKQGNVATMNRLLHEKWGAKDWTEML